MTRYPITPVAKPRMTRRDKWAQRPCVLRYREFCDLVRLHGIDLGETVSVVFWLPMPKSWSKKMKQEMDGKPHQQKPDVDNMCKSLLDASFDAKNGLTPSNFTSLGGAIPSLVFIERQMMHRPRWQCSCKEHGGIMVHQFCVEDPCVDWLNFDEAENEYASGDVVVRRWPLKEDGSWNYDIMLWHEKSFAVWGFSPESQFLRIAGGD